MNSSPLSKKDMLEGRIKEKTVQNTITCPELRKIAEDLRVSYREAGKRADELSIKIKNCDLGCF